MGAHRIMVTALWQKFEIKTQTVSCKEKVSRKFISWIFIYLNLYIKNAESKHQGFFIYLYILSSHLSLQSETRYLLLNRPIYPVYIKLKTFRPKIGLCNLPNNKLSRKGNKIYFVTFQNLN